MPTRTARTTWDGGFQDGSGQVELTSSGLATFDVSWPRRVDDDNSDTTTPEELIGAAHSACYAMSLVKTLEDGGVTAQSLDVRADVSFGPDPHGGMKITGIVLTVRGEADGIDAAGFEAAAESAKTGCPVSKALGGTDITVEATLATP
jgi:osmotically inducible protein OsmC